MPNSLQDGLERLSTRISAEALQLIKAECERRKNRFAVRVPMGAVVTDMVLHGSQGLLLSKHCADLGIPTITLTGREFHADQAGRELPLALLEKPFRFSDLQRVLNAVEAARSGAAFSGGTSNAA